MSYVTLSYICDDPNATLSSLQKHQEPTLQGMAITGDPMSPTDQMAWLNSLYLDQDALSSWVGVARTSCKHYVTFHDLLQIKLLNVPWCEKYTI